METPVTAHGEGSGHPAGCFGCRVKTVQVSPAATPTRTPSKAPPAPSSNAWERGLATDGRGMPISGEKGPMGVKEYADNRKATEARLKEIKDPEYWASREPSPVTS